MPADKTWSTVSEKRFRADFEQGVTAKATDWPFDQF